MTSDPVDQARDLIAAGRLADARRLLGPVIKANPQIARAWLLEVETWPDPTSKIKILETALRFNPGDPQLSAALAGFQSELSASTPTPSQARTPRWLSMPAWRVTLACLAVVILGVAAGALFLWIRKTVYCGVSPNTVAVKVLFIGNSYTMVNDLPRTFTKLSCAGGHPVEASMVASGGWTLANHVASPDTLAKLQEQKWDFVILQEQSQIPAQPAARTTGMYPAARQLVGKIIASGAKPVFFLTPAHANGWPEDGMPSFDAMQAQLTVGYLGIAKELHVPVAPVGVAWSVTRTQAPDLELWQSDGSHPTNIGTYLAACVFYATLFSQSPVGLTYTSDLSLSAAATLQNIAGETVLKDPQRWNLP